MEQNRYVENTIDRSPLIMRTLNHLGPDIDSFDTIVELGSSTGKTISAISSVTTSQCYGFDIVPNGSATKNLAFRKVDLNTDLTHDFFDEFGKSLFFALDVVEHLHDPFKLVYEFEQFAKEGSVLILSSPNFASVRILQAWIQGELPKHEYGFFDKTHLHWLTPRNFKSFDRLSFAGYIYSEKVLFKAIQVFLPKRLCSQFVVTFSK